MEVTSLRPSQGLISRPALHQRSGNHFLATSQQGGFSLNVCGHADERHTQGAVGQGEGMHWKCEEVSGVDYPARGAWTAASTGDLQWPAASETHP